MQRYSPRDILILIAIAALIFWYVGGLRLFNNPLAFLLFIGALVLAITFHEFSHAFVAYQLGDATAKMLGRVSLNPIRHLDLFGSLAFLFVGFGWGKPVPINPYNMRGVSPLLGGAISAIAGPTSNVVFAYLATLPFRLELVSRGSLETVFLEQLIRINVALAAFNFLPIPPLDGFSLARLVLPRHVSYWLEQYGMFILLALVFLPQLFGGQFDFLSPIMRPLYRFIDDLVRP